MVILAPLLRGAVCGCAAVRGDDEDGGEVLLFAAVDTTQNSPTPLPSRSCFGVRQNGHVYTAEGCCDVRTHGPGGDARCWGYDEELQADTSFERCCIKESLSDGLLADRPPLLIDVLLELHPNPAKIWAAAWQRCQAQNARRSIPASLSVPSSSESDDYRTRAPCRNVEVYFSGLGVNPGTGRLEASRNTEDWRGPTGAVETPLRRAFIDVGSHVMSRFLPKLAQDPEALLIALEPDRASCRYHLDYAHRLLGYDEARRRFWLLPAAAGPELDLAVLHRANHFFDGQCSSLLPFRENAVTWKGCTELTGEDIVSTVPLEVIFRRLPDSIEHIEMKVDVQGFDLQAVLSSGPELHRVAKLTIEVQDTAEDDVRVRYVGQKSREEIVATLLSKGFKLDYCEPYSDEAAMIQETDCHFVRGTGEVQGGGGKQAPRVHLVTFADGEPIFSKVQSLIGATALQAGFSSHIAWNMRKIEQRLGESPHPLTDVKTGSFLPFGTRWWKPFVILDRLQDDMVSEGDWVIYQDSSRYVQLGFNATHGAQLAELVARLEAEGAVALVGFALPQSIGWSWAQRCVPNYMMDPADWFRARSADMLTELCKLLRFLQICKEGDAACCEYFQEKPMLQNAWMAFRKEAVSVDLAREWLQWSTNAEASRSLPFADQSLLELLAHGRRGRDSEAPFWTLSASSLEPEALAAGLTRGQIARKDTRNNRFKHLGVALSSFADGSDDEMSLLPVGGVQPAWRRAAAGIDEATWRRSLCRV